MLQLNNLPSVTQKRKRIGRGGKRGGHSGRGNDGQLCRSGGRSEIRPFFEGGQMPLARRLPCRGFTSLKAEKTVILSLSEIDRHYNEGEVVNRETLREKGLLKGKNRRVKILGSDSFTKKLTFLIDDCSASAKDAILATGGTISLVREIEGDNSAS